MRKINMKSSLIYLVMVVLVAGFFGSCTKDDATAADGQVKLLSFGPSGQELGGKLSFIGNNLDLVKSIKLEGVEVDKANFISQTDKKIEINIPMETLEGKVILVYEGGEVESKTILSFDVPFMINSISAKVKPGENLIITGKYLKWIKSVVFNNNVEVLEFVSATNEQLVVKVPAEAKTGPVVITGKGTEVYEFISESDIVITLPKITSSSPESIKQNDILTITGTDLDLVLGVTFAGSTEVRSFESQTATQIKVKVPATAVDGKIIISTISGILSEAPSVTKIIVPVLTSSMPKPVAIGAELTLVGTNLDLVKEVIVPGAVSPVTSFVSQSATKIVFKVPALTFNGAIKLKTVGGATVPTTEKIEIAGLTNIPLQQVIYDDQLRNNYGNWSWGGNSNLEYTSEVLEGAKSIRKDFQDNDGLRFNAGGKGLLTEGMTDLVFSVYGGAGLDNGQKLGVMVNEAWGITSVVVKIGQWTEYSIPLASLKGLPTPKIINDFCLQGKGGYILVDKVGLR